MFAQPSAEHDLDTGFTEHCAEGVLGDMWFREPIRCAVEARSAVMLGNAAIKQLRISADHLRIAEVGGGKPSRNHAAEMMARLEKHDTRALARGRVGGHDAGSRAAVNEDVLVDR